MKRPKLGKAKFQLSSKCKTVTTPFMRSIYETEINRRQSVGITPIIRHRIGKRFILWTLDWSLSRSPARLIFRDRSLRKESCRFVIDISEM